MANNVNDWSVFVSAGPKLPGKGEINGGEQSSHPSIKKDSDYSQARGRQPIPDHPETEGPERSNRGHGREEVKSFGLPVHGYLYRAV